MIKYCCIFLFLLSHSFLCAIDSLQIQVKLEQLEEATDTQRLRLLDELSWTLRISDNAKAKALSEEGLILAAQLSDSITYYNLYSNLAIITAIQNKFDESIQHLDRSLHFFQRTNNVRLEEKTLSRLGTVCSHFGSYQKADSLLLLATLICEKTKNEERLLDVQLNRGINAYYWKKFKEAKIIYTKSLKLSQKIGDTQTAAKLLMNLGLVEASQNNKVKALDYYLQAAKNDHDDDLFKSKIFNNIGILYDDLNELEKALEYHQKSLTIKRKLGLQKNIANSLNNIGSVYKKKFDYGEALKYFKESLAIKTKMEGTNNDLAETINNIGAVLLELDKYTEAEDHFKRALKIEEDSKDQFGESRALNNLASTYQESGKYQKAINYGLRSLELAENIKNLSIVQLSAKTISESYETLGNFKQALLYKNKYWAIKDSTSGSEVANKIKELEIKYETAKKENDLQLKNEEVKNLEKQRLIDRLKIGLLILFCSILALIVGMMTKRKRKLTRNKELAESKVELMTQENLLLGQKNSAQQIQLNNYLKQLLTKTEKLQDLINSADQSQKEENEHPMDSNILEFLIANLQPEEGLKQFKYFFTIVHKDFFKKIINTHSNLTNSDLSLCALIKLNMNNKEIAQILNISPSSVKSARQRLYQKMNLSDNEALRNYIFQF